MMKYLVSFEKKNSLLNFVKNITLNIPRLLNKIEIIENNFHSYEITIYASSKNLSTILVFLKYFTCLQFEQLIDMSAIDCLSLKQIDDARFKIFYQLLSLRYNKRLTLCIFDLNEKLSLNSVANLYYSANWLEREVWDMFGIFFWEHPDLRRILTDYGFKGFPLRKDFPLSGFSEVRYDDEIKLVFYEPIELSQEFRYFDALSPWIKY